MQLKFRFYFTLIIFIFDLLILFAVYNASFIYTDKINYSNLIQLYNNNTLSVFRFFILWFIFSGFYGLYSIKNEFSLDQIYRSTWKSIAMHQIVFLIFTIIENKLSNLSVFIIVEISIFLFLFLFSRLLISFIYFFIRNKLITSNKLYIIGYNKNGINLAHYFESRPLEFLFGGFLDNKNQIIDEVEIESIFNIAKEKDIHNIYLVHHDNYKFDIDVIFHMSEKFGIKLKYVNEINTSQYNKFHTRYDRNFQIISNRNEKLEQLTERIKKKILDLFFSIFVILFILSWLYPIFALIIKLQSKGPVIFKQIRNGRGNKEFKCYKFRSMYSNNFDTQIQATKNDYRVTPIGKFLRKYNLDELPQFFNVLKGEMSVVGPRPHMVEHNEIYDKIIEKYLVRNFIKPGITGWAQVNGLRGETKDIDKMVERVKLDIEYLDNWSLMFDIRIIFLTVYISFKGDKNAY